jgi:hypothetical protein
MCGQWEEDREKAVQVATYPWDGGRLVSRRDLRVHGGWLVSLTTAPDSQRQRRRAADYEGECRLLTNTSLVSLVSPATRLEAKEKKATIRPSRDALGS